MLFRSTGMGDSAAMVEAQKGLRGALEKLCEEALANKFRRLEPLEIRALVDQLCEQLVAFVDARIEWRLCQRMLPPETGVEA